MSFAKQVKSNLKHSMQGGRGWMGGVLPCLGQGVVRLRACVHLHTFACGVGDWEGRVKPGRRGCQWGLVG